MKINWMMEDFSENISSALLLSSFNQRHIRSMAAPHGGPDSDVLKFGFGTNGDLNPMVRWNRGRNDDTFRITRTNLRNRLVNVVKRVGILLEWNSQVVKAEGECGVFVKRCDLRFAP